MRNIVLLAGLITSLTLVNSLIISKEHLLKNGAIVLVELAPRDPRSILQGDYMRLRYRLARTINARVKATGSTSGQAVIRLDQNNVASFVRLYESGTALSANEYLLLFRKRGDNVRLATDAYFFEEGMGSIFQAARYGELTLDKDGDAVLTGLHDADFKRLPHAPAS